MVSVMLHKRMNVEEAVTLDIDDSREKDVCSEVQVPPSESAHNFEYRCCQRSWLALNWCHTCYSNNEHAWYSMWYSSVLCLFQLWFVKCKWLLLIIICTVPFVSVVFWYNALLFVVLMSQLVLYWNELFCSFGPSMSVIISEFVHT